MIRHHHAQELELQMRKIAILMRQNTKSLLATHDITLPQYYALIQLRDQRLTMGDLCSRLFLASSTVTDLIDRMESVKLVQRIRDDQDRRVIRIELLPGGKAIIDRVVEERLNFLSKRLFKMDDANVDVLMKTVKELQHLMEQQE